MPHLTEELWQRLPGHEAIHPETICLAPFPEADPGWTISTDEQNELERIRAFVTLVRNDRAELVSGEKGTKAEQRKAKAFIEGKDETARDFAAWLASSRVFSLNVSLSSLSEVVQVDELPSGGARHREWGVDFSIEFPALAEKVGGPDPEKVSKELAEVEAALERVCARLGNPGFAEKAPAAVVEGARRQQAELEERRARLAESLAAAGAERA
jgi:valyl-tRNA synthetase